MTRGELKQVKIVLMLGLYMISLMLSFLFAGELAYHLTDGHGMGFLANLLFGFFVAVTTLIFAIGVSIVISEK